MTLKEREQNGAVVLELSGKIMGGPDATVLNEKLHELIDNNKSKVVADLGKVSWMNSSGLGIAAECSTHHIPDNLDYSICLPDHYQSRRR